MTLREYDTASHVASSVLRKDYADFATKTPHVSNRGRAKKIVAELEARGLLEVVGEFCDRHHVTVEQVCSPSRQQPACSVRHVIWARLVDYFGENGGYSTVARIWGTHHTTVLSAVRHVDETQPEIVFVQLATFETPATRIDLIYERRDGHHQIGVRVDGAAQWFGADYKPARELFSKLCEGAGARTFRTHAANGAS